MSDLRDPGDDTPSRVATPSAADTTPTGNIVPPIGAASSVDTAPPVGDTAPIAESPPVVEAPPVATTPDARKLPPTRVGAAWVALCTIALVAIALLIFMLQNTQRVRVTFLGFHASVPLALALLIATLGGILLVLVIGTIRITQLRRMARRPERLARSRRR